jgi:hypothetical protein
MQAIGITGNKTNISKIVHTRVRKIITTVEISIFSFTFLQLNKKNELK